MLLPRKSVLLAPSSRNVRDSERWPLTENGLPEVSSGSGRKNAGLEQAELQSVAIEQAEDR